jgi:hypothetical protein
MASALAKLVADEQGDELIVDRMEQGVRLRPRIARSGARRILSRSISAADVSTPACARNPLLPAGRRRLTRTRLTNPSSPMVAY